MADQKISDLSDGGAPQDTDELVIARAGSNFSLLFSAIKAAIPGGVSSVFSRTGAVTAQTGDYTAAQVGALPSTETLDQIATANATAASVAINTHKLTGLAAGTTNGDSVRYEQIPTALPPNGSAGGDLSGTYPNPAVAPAANVAMGTHKLTGLAAGSGAGDSVRYEQAVKSGDTAGGDLSGTYPNPAVKAITETSGPTDLVIGTITDGQFLKRVGSTLVSAAGGGFSNPMTTKGDIIIEDASPAPARLAIGATGQVLEVVSGLPAWVYPSGYEYDYVERTTVLTVTATTEGTAQAWIDGNAVSYDGSTRILIEAWSNYVSVTNGDAVPVLFDGSSAIGWLGEISNALVSSTTGTFYGARFLTPSNASHTYHVKWWKTGGTVIVTGGAGGSGADMPSWYRITKA